MSLTNYNLVTFHDVLNHVLEAVVGADYSQRNIRQAKRAIIEAYQELPAMRDWRYFYRRLLIRTAASQSSSTITYDHCVTPEHEALTRDGWKTYDQLRVGEEILSYDHDTETCSWQPIEALHVFDYQGDVLEVERKGRTVLRCTPNHRIPVWERCSHGRGKPRTYRKKFVKASELTLEHTTPLAAPLDIEDAGPLTPRLAALLAWCVTDGCGLFNRKYHAANVLQSAKANPGKCEEIESLVGRRGRPYGDGMKRFPLMSYDRQVLRSLVAGKHDLTKMICRMGIQQAEAVVRAMILAEASTNESNQQKIFTQWGDNKPVAEAFQVACLLAGKAVNFCVQPWRGKVRYQCTVRHSGGIKLAKQSRWVPYEGKVWCPQVRTTAWVVRCNGAVMITGNSGGASERLLTLASGTWPSDAEKYEIIIDNVRYEIERRLSSTTLQLSERANPGSDVAAGTSYTLVRDTYELPSDFLSMWELVDVEAPGRLQSLPWPSDVLVENRINKAAGLPTFYSVMRTTKFASGYAVVFAPAPSAAREYDAVIKVAPQALQVLDDNAGTVTLANESADVAGTSTAFGQQHVGAVMRLSKNSSSIPTSLVGQIDSDLLNPYALQRVIKRVTDTTNLVLEQASDYGSTLTGVNYRISSRVDIEPGAMFTYFQRLCEAKFAPLDRKGVAEREALAERAFHVAAWADQRMRDDPGRPFQPHSLADIAASVNPTTEA